MDLQEFLHEKLPKLLLVALISWVLMWVLRLVTDRILRVAERQASTAGHSAQVRTLVTVIRATGHRGDLVSGGAAGAADFWGSTWGRC